MSKLCLQKFTNAAQIPFAEFALLRNETDFYSNRTTKPNVADKPVNDSKESRNKKT